MLDFAVSRSGPAALSGKEPEALSVCGVLNDQGVLGLDHLRLWGHFNDLVATGIGRKLKAETSLYMTATAHANMAFVHLRKLLDTPRRAVSMSYLLKVVDKTMPTLVRETATRDPALAWSEQALRQALASHRMALADLEKRAAPALTMVNQLIVHVDDGHLRDPIAMGKLIEQSRVTHETFTAYFRCAQWIVNSWDLAWRCAQVDWEAPVNRDDFAPIRAALTAGALGKSAPGRSGTATPRS
mgnify:CR=1 FL=1